MGDLKPNQPLGRIDALAENIRVHARRVAEDMKLTPGGDAYEYNGTTAAVDDLLEAINELEHFQAGWIS
jgi:hypothetical protein